MLGRADHIDKQSQSPFQKQVNLVERKGKVNMEAEERKIRGICEDVLPCSTNKTCKEVTDLRKVVDKIDTRTWLILATIILGTAVQIALKF